MAKLGELYKITSGGTPSRNHSEYFENGTIPWVKTGDLKDKYLFETDEKISQLGLENSSARIYLKNTVLLAMYGATIGATSILEIDAATNQACAAFSPREDVLPEYLYAFLESQKDKFIKDAVGGAQPNLSAGYLKNIDFDYPPLEQQTKITNTLNKTDELLLLRKQQLAKLDELVKARFVEMFGDHKSDLYNWTHSTIGECCVLKSGTSLPADRENEGGNIPYIKVGDMNIARNRQYITTSSRFVTEQTAGNGIFPVGTVIFPKRGGAIGTNKKRLTVRPICADLNIMGVTAGKQLVSQYLMAYFSMIDLGKLNNGSSVPQINNKDIAPLPINLPPIKLQNQFSDFVERVDQQKQTVQQSLEKLELMKKALMQEYFG